MVAALAALVLALCAGAGAGSGAGFGAGSGTGSGERSGGDVERWREMLELDLAAQVASEGRAAVERGGALARDGEAVALVATALFATGEERAARELLEGADVPAAQLAWIEIARARIALEHDELDRVVALLAAEPDAAAPVRRAEHPEAWILLARAHGRAGRLERAAPLCERFLELAPLHGDAPVAWHLLGRRAVELGDRAALELCTEREAFLRKWHAVLRARRLQVRLAPDEPLPRLGLALCWMEVERFADAIAILEPLVERHPDLCRGWFHLAEARRRTNAIDAALAAYDETLACDAEYHQARFHRGLVHHLRRDAERARADFEALLGTPLAADRRFAHLHLYLARLLAAAGERDAALERHAAYVALGGTEPLDE